MDPRQIAHPQMPRRSLLQVGGLSLLGLSAGSLSLCADEVGSEEKSSSKRSVIYIFLSGGLSQHESFVQIKFKWTSTGIANRLFYFSCGCAYGLSGFN